MIDLSKIILEISSTNKVSQDIYPMRVYKLLCNQGFIPEKLKYIHITGSKGKGSLAYTIWNLLKYSECKVGLFTSPHIFDICERFVTERGQITAEKLYQLIEKYKNFLVHWQLHFFEICLFLAIVYFLEEKCEYVVLEVGIGGRFDPTNFCRPLISLFGHIILEHQEFLGSTIQEIAYDKAGIIKKDIPALSVDQDPIVQKILLSEGKVKFSSEFIEISNITYKSEYSTVFDLNIKTKDHLKIFNLELKQIGKASISNFSLAVAAVLEANLPLTESVIRKVGLDKIPYRMDLFIENVLIDTAHTGSSFFNLMESLQNQMNWHNIILYITILKGKNINEIVDVLILYRSIIKEIIVFDFPMQGKRESNGYVLYNLLKHYFIIHYTKDLSSITVDKTEKNVFAGSFYSLPLINSILQNKYN